MQLTQKLHNQNCTWEDLKKTYFLKTFPLIWTNPVTFNDEQVGVFKLVLA